MSHHHDKVAGSVLGIHGSAHTETGLFGLTIYVVYYLLTTHATPLVTLQTNQPPCTWRPDADVGVLWASYHFPATDGCILALA